MISKFDPKRISVVLLRNLSVVCGIGCVALLLLACLPSARNFVFLGVGLGCLAACIGITVGARMLAKKWELTFSIAIEKATFWAYIALIVMMFVVLVPFWMLLVTSVKYLAEANDAAFTWWPQMGFQFESYKEVFTDNSMGISLVGAFFNTLLYSLPTTVACVFVSSLSAYAFAKLYFPGNRFVFSFLIFTMMIPGCVTMTSSYIIFDRIGWTGTPLPFTITALFGNVSMLFFMREYFMGIPDELLEAARVEGAGKLTIYFRIILPLGMPAITAQLILNFITRFNDYLDPLIYLRWPENYTLQLVLSQFNKNSSADNSLLAASCVLSMLPLLLIYLVFQGQILKGISMTSGLKG